MWQTDRVHSDGVPVLEAVCLPIRTEFKVNVYDTFGDGMCGSCYGGVDGNLSVTTLCRNYYVGDTTQFESVGSDILEVGLCVPPVPQGCTDPWFIEYDPHAVIDDRAGKQRLSMDAQFLVYQLQPRRQHLGDGRQL